MEIMKTVALNICVLLAVSGCARHFSDVSPYVKAQTIDAATNKPISGAVAYCIERPNIRAISDSDGILIIIKAKEQIRYFLSDKDLKRGIIKPSGSPLSYNSANEQISTLVTGINNGVSPIFEYFDSSYTGTSTPLVQPVQITQVRLVRVTLKIEEDTNPTKTIGPVIVTSQVFLRNLKDNL